jgi:phosphomannomutase
VALFDPRLGDYRMLTGDEVGSALGVRATIVGLLPGRPRRGRDLPEPPTLASSVVSSRLLAKIAAERGLRYAATLTGFKWIARTAGLVFGYEEAIGYCVRPDMVRDKDGITAGLAVAELVAALSAHELTLLDLLDDLARVHGLHLTSQVAVPLGSPQRIAATIARVTTAPPRRLGGSAVVECVDLSAGAYGLPSTPGVSWTMADASRVIIRPSGTEPKVKCYLEVIRPVQLAASYADLTAARRAGTVALSNLAMAVRTTLAA